MAPQALRALVTAPPYAPFLKEVAQHPLVCGLRLNTVMPLREGPAEALRRLRDLGQPLWVDLKGRQLRVVGAALPPVAVSLTREVDIALDFHQDLLLYYRALLFPCMTLIPAQQKACVRHEGQLELQLAVHHRNSGVSTQRDSE